MALYPQLTAGIGTNGINSNLFPFDVSDIIFREWVQLTPLSTLIGDSPTSPIVRKSMKVGAGVQWRVPKLNALDYKNPIKNFDQRRGNAQQQSVDYDVVNSDFRSQLVQIKLFEILKYATPVNLRPEASRQLVEVFSRNLNYELIADMTKNVYPALTTGSALVGNVAGAYPSYDRALVREAAGTFVARGAYQANATFPTLLNGMSAPAATTAATSGLGTAVLNKLKQYAERGNAGDIAASTECPIMPAQIRSKAGWPMNRYIALCHPEAIPTLLTDAVYERSTVSRGVVIDAANQPNTLDGAEYVGEFNGISIFSCKDLYDLEIISQDGNKRAAWNLFLGAGAMSLGWPEKPRIGMEIDQVENIELYFGHELRGQKMLQFKSRYGTSAAPVAGSNTVIEQGVIHFFTSLPA